MRLVVLTVLISSRGICIGELMSHTYASCRIRQALVWVFLTRGIPILYYGTEQGLDGHQGPHNNKGQDNLRESLWQTGGAWRGACIGDEHVFLRCTNAFDEDHVGSEKHL